MILNGDQQRQVFYEGGLREEVKLAGKPIIVGELSHRDRLKLFTCMEEDAREFKVACDAYLKKNHFGFLGRLFGRKPEAISLATVFRRYVNGLTKNDVRFILLCSAQFNKGMSKGDLERMIYDAPYSEVQQAIRKCLEVNGIELKNLLAARPTVPGAAAGLEKTSTVG